MDTDLQKQAQDFSISSKLRNVAEGLEKLTKGELLEDTHLRSFEWTQKLIAQMQGYEKHPELSVSATELRPQFYAIFGQGYLETIHKILEDYEKNTLLDGELIQMSKKFDEVSSNVLRTLHTIGNI